MSLEFKHLYCENKVPIINPLGNAGIVTLWTKIDGNAGYKAKLSERHPKLFEPDSNLVALTNLYGNGLPQMLANLAYNPQIERIAITGNRANTNGREALINFFEQGVEEIEVGGVKMSRIKETDYLLGLEVNPSLFKYFPEIQVFKTSDYEGVANFVQYKGNRNVKESDRMEIELVMPKFKDFSSDLTNHNIIADTPLEAWMDVMFHIDRYGKNMQLEKGLRRSLFNLDVTIRNPNFESDDLLKKLNFDPQELKEYQKFLLNPELPEDQPYSYGNRMRGYWGLDSLDIIIERLRKNPLDRHSLVSLWDTGNDLTHEKKESSAPCFTDAYFINLEGKLIMTAGFRTHNAVSAWLTNIYGLRAVQEYVANGIKIPAGQLNVRSRWISIDPENSKTNSALKLIKQHRKIKLDVDDPKGYFQITIDREENEIVAQHYSPEGIQVEEIRGPSATSIKNQLRQLNPFSTQDHAMWVGLQLAKAQFELTGELPKD